MDITNNQSTLSTASRVRRLITGSVMIGIVMNVTGPLGYLALLPLLAVYPLLTGMIGEDPLNGLLANWQGGFEGKSFAPSTRVALLLLGAVAIAALMVSPDGAGLRSWLAIAALYPIMMGLFGEDLVTIALGFGRNQPSPAPRQGQVVTAFTPKVTAAHHHGLNHQAGHKAA